MVAGLRISETLYYDFFMIFFFQFDYAHLKGYADWMHVYSRRSKRTNEMHCVTQTSIGLSQFIVPLDMIERSKISRNNSFFFQVNMIEYNKQVTFISCF